MATIVLTMALTYIIQITTSNKFEIHIILIYILNFTVPTI